MAAAGVCDSSGAQIVHALRQSQNGDKRWHLCWVMQNGFVYLIMSFGCLAAVTVTVASMYRSQVIAP